MSATGIPKSASLELAENVNFYFLTVSSLYKTEHSNQSFFV